MELPFAEAWKIKMVEPIRKSTRQEREQWLKEAHYNVFQLKSEQVYIDLITDSGTGAMSDRQWAGMMLGDESYAGATSFFKLKEVITRLTGFEYIIPTHQGRAAENVLFSYLVHEGDIVPGNSHFDTTKGHIEGRRALALDCTIDEAKQTQLEIPFKGNVDPKKLEKALQEHRIDLALVEGNTRQPNLKYTPFLQDELVAIVHTHSKWMDYDEITLDELKEVPLVLRERGSGTLDVLITALHKHNIKLSDLTIRMHLGSTESIKLFLENSECMGILSIRSINKELYSGKFKVLDIKDLVMFREFDFVQLQGQDTGLPALFMQFANHYKEKL